MAKNNKTSYFTIDGGILLHSEGVCGEDVKQVVLTLCKIKYVLSVAREISLSLRYRRTENSTDNPVFLLLA